MKLYQQMVVIQRKEEENSFKKFCQLTSIDMNFIKIVIAHC